jgi:hypothetical protein
MDEVTKVLIRVRKRLSNPEAWTKHSKAKDRYGAAVGYNSPEACSWCLLGAIQRESADSRQDDHVIYRMRSFIRADRRDRFLVSINDNPRTTHQDILKWLDTVINYYR